MPPTIEQQKQMIHCTIYLDLFSLLSRCPTAVNDLLAIRKDGLLDEWQAAIRRALQTIESVDESRLLDPAALNVDG